MRFISETTSNGVPEPLFTGVSQPLFTLGNISGVLWSPTGAAGSPPLALPGRGDGDGGGRHTRAQGIDAPQTHR